MCWKVVFCLPIKIFIQIYFKWLNFVFNLEGHIEGWGLRIGDQVWHIEGWWLRIGDQGLHIEGWFEDLKISDGVLKMEDWGLWI